MKDQVQFFFLSSEILENMTVSSAKRVLCTLSTTKEQTHTYANNRKNNKKIDLMQKKYIYVGKQGVLISEFG